MIIESMYDHVKQSVVSRDERWPNEWLTRAEIAARVRKIMSAHISPLVPAQHGNVAEKVATDTGMRITPIAHSDGVQGYIINGTACNTAVFPDSTSPADQLLFALIKELQK